MADLIPDWASAVPNAPVHDAPAQAGGGWQAPMTWQQLVATVQFFLDSIIGQIAVAFGGIDIFGWHPLQFLADWGQQRIDDASAAYAAALGAQTTGDSAQTGANVANIEIAIIKADLAADASGGSALSDKFDGAASGSLDPALWSQTYSGPGGGNLGLDGSGNAVWFPTGGGPRLSVNVFLTPLDTDNESVTVLLGAVPDATNAQWPEIHLCLRMDGAGNGVVGRIINSAVQIGYMTSNVFTALGSQVAVPMSGQQSYQLTARTVGATHTFAVLQDNIEVASLTSPTSGATLYGASYRNPGWISSAGTGFSFPVFFQNAAPVVRVFSASDIL